jgi:hypothetical protein
MYDGLFFKANRNKNRDFIWNSLLLYFHTIFDVIKDKNMDFFHGEVKIIEDCW